MVSTGYRSQAEDICLESDQRQMALLRQRSPAQRWQIASGLIHWAKTVSLRGMKQRQGEKYAQCFAQSILEEKWQPVLTPNSNETMWTQDPSDIAKLLHPIFERLAIPYYITGGVAAIVYGDPRTTRDLDIVIAIPPDTLDLLVQSLESAGFYVPLGAVEEVAAGQGQVISVTHMEKVLNADLVITGSSAFDQSKFARRQLLALDLAGVEQYWIISPEDLVLAKLLWGQRQQSEKQWRDVLGVLKVQAEGLDRRYLKDWVDPLGLRDRLSEAFAQSGLES